MLLFSKADSMFFFRIWYFISGRFHYKGPQSNLHEADKDHKLRAEDESRNALHHVDA